MNYSDTFFGGKQKVQERLVTSITDGIKRMQIAEADLDAVCGFGKGPKHLPKTSEFCANPSLLKSSSFSLAALALNIRLDTILPLNSISEEDKANILNDMKATRSAAVSAMPGVNSGISKPEPVDQFRVFVRLKILQEIDRT